MTHGENIRLARCTHYTHDEIRSVVAAAPQVGDAVVSDWIRLANIRGLTFEQLLDMSRAAREFL